MVNLPPNKYIEDRHGGYYIRGTRIGLDGLVYAFRRGETAEEILQAYPSIGSLAQVYGAITFVLENPQLIEAYLADQERLWREVREAHPLPEELLELFRQADKTRV